MRKIVMFNRISIAAFLACLNQETWGIDWFLHDPEVDKTLRELGGPSDTPLL